MAVVVCGDLYIHIGYPVCSLPAFTACSVVACFISYPIQLPMTMDVALSRKKSLYTVFPKTFCERRLGPVSALDKLFFPSCELHVLHVVLTTSQPTHT